MNIIRLIISKNSDWILILAVYSNADLFSWAAYLCLHQEPMLVNALSRLLETVAKSIKHATVLSTIF